MHRSIFRRSPRSAAMTLFLASVTGAEEAQVALAHGADIVDLKDPAKGALGALSEETVQAAVAGFAGALLDTAGKGGGRLLDHMDIPALREFVAACRSHGLLAGLAGSLETPDVPRLLLLQPDVLGFRTALCAGRVRTAPIEATAVDVVRELIPLDERRAAYEPQRAPVDHRLLAARGYSFDPTKDAPTDHVFVHDLVLPVRVGAYASEHEKPQRVRFNVDVKVLRPPHEAEDMRDVFSYDVITDGIGMIVARGHVTLAETLAERIAALLLEHPRVVRVTVRLEKLDLGPGAVGVTVARA